MSEWVITVHALDQYISRWCDPSIDREEARAELMRLLEGAKSSHKAVYGGQVWVSGERSEIRLLIKDTNVCVTVLPPDTKVRMHLDMAEHYQSQVDDVQAEVGFLKSQIDEINQKRKELGDEKSRLCNQLQDAENRLKMLDWMNKGEAR